MPHQPQLIKEPKSPYEEARDAEREAYLEKLKQHLQEPAFRAIEGFPIGEDKDILALSDPPYYTACPNPFLPELIERWQKERDEIRDEMGLPDDSADDRDVEPVYHREPFATDVSEGKRDALYRAHAYHTKVPHKAIMRYILHYTDPGDITYDGFCGTGMAGVAAQLCGDKKAIVDLGLRVSRSGEIYDGDERISHLGVRKALLVDLSPAATFIAHNYNTPLDVSAYEREMRRILRELKDEYGWMYETMHTDGKTKGQINYTVWSEVFSCPECANEIVFIDQGLDAETERVKREFACPNCGAILSKRDLERHLDTLYDPLLGRTVEALRLRPSLVEYTVGEAKYTKDVDAFDHQVIESVTQLPPSIDIPSGPMPIDSMYHGSRIAPKGVTHLHHFFLPRAQRVLAALWAKAEQVADPRIRSFVLYTAEQAIWGMSLMNRYSPTHYSQVNRYLSGVYYISSLISEVSPWYILDGKLKRLLRAFGRSSQRADSVAISTQSSSNAALPENSVDYVFTDPPFGENIYYADLNYLVESWHGVRTDSEPEAIVDQAKNKQLVDYQDLMRKAFRVNYQILKPGRWMTVEFHNSHNAVWNAIQEAILSAGFVVADVRTLDKKQGSYRQVTAASAAKQDLVISAYKPRSGFEQRFLEASGSEAGVWDFVRQHLDKLPVVVATDGALEVVAEREAYLLFDRMVAFHIQRGFSVPMGAAEFYAGLKQRFPERDGMYFLPEQAAEYDRHRLQARTVEQLSLFVNDEKSAIQWLRRELDPELGGGPQTYQDLQPKFLRELHQARHEDLPELSEMLVQNFLQDEETDRWYVPDPGHQADLEKLRERSLLREFQEYAQGKGRLRVFRTEAVRVGFKHAWSGRAYRTIVRVAERLPSQVLQEDPALLMYYDNALLRVDEEPEQGVLW